MEKPLKQPIIQHFSHEHLLERRLSPPQGNCICFGCKLDMSPGKYCYKCKKCPFYLHQVCYNMPQKVQHPVDPNHHLTLLALPLSNEKSIECKACQQPITGFYYNCATCGTFYHMLCLATPISVKLPVHPHTLKLEFSPPYKFQCDLCQRPSHQGWLYRCGICEVDVHMSCAIMDSQHKLQLQARPLSSHERKDGDSKRQELMELLLQGIMEAQDKQTFQCLSQYQDQQTPMSDNTAPPSFQLSDACFSIDIERSFTLDGLTSKEGDFHQLDCQESKETRKFGYVVLTKGIVQDPVISIATNPSFDSYVGDSQKLHNIGISPAIRSQVWMDLAQENEPIQVKASNAGLKHDSKKSDSARSCCSCW